MALIVEDGTGMVDANSYVSVSEADTYISETYPEDVEWDVLSVVEKESKLIKATRFLDTQIRWTSSIKDNEQSLAWPREDFKDKEGRIISSDSVPTLVKEAEMELALDSISNTLTTESIKLQSEKFGDTTETYSSPVTVGGNELVRNIVKNFIYAGYATNRATTVIRHRV